ncbi:hypothetical protein FBU31_004674 [Coemansia sp. 'formosensis']|nr:hypothetical protein FBU31_004674 [Coemansia sp. 'formosensis']
MASSDIDPLSVPAPGIGRVACAWGACSAEFASSYLLAIHLSLAHISPDPHAHHSCQWQSCPQYKILAPTRYDMILHLKTHTGDRSYLCPFDGCDKVYKRSDFLIRHTNLHATPLSSTRQPSTRTRDLQITARADLLLHSSSPSESDDDDDDDRVMQSPKHRLSASDSDSYHPPLSASSEPTEAMLEAQLAYISEQVAERTKKLTRVKEKSRRLRLENDILIDALEQA